eukprot:TRINITY_DN9179_c0_g1_i1.p1 TRINITY_DN9179_c0_g1~~TRINITY_DN9179_c0_g1_i1.p1  ORF type:complete len:761 (+),score=163.34 TRINITY_DN9179_c0_g1_i1:91-2373(+)
MEWVHATKQVQTHVRQLPFIYRLTLLSLFPFLFILVPSCFVFTDLDSSDTEFELYKFTPTFGAELGTAVNALERERKAALRFATNRTEFQEAVRSTDTSLFALKKLSFDSEKSLALIERRGTFSYRFNSKRLTHIRHLILHSGVDQNEIFSTYMDLMRNAGQTARLTAQFLEERGQRVGAYFGVSLATSFLKMELAARHLGATASEKVFAANRKLYLQWYTDGYAVDQETLLSMHGGVFSDPSWLEYVEEPLPTYKALGDEEYAVYEQEDAEVSRLLEKVIDAFNARTLGQLEGGKDDVHTFSALAKAIVVVLCVFLVFECALCVVRMQNSLWETERSEEIALMVETVNRVCEYTSNFALFNLTVKRLPAGKTLTQLELALMKSMSALKVIAPSLPAELFAERYIVKPQVNEMTRNAEMCDMEIMMCQLPPLHSDASLRKPDYNPLKAIALMTERCKLGMREVEATILTVTFTWIHAQVDAIKDEPCCQPKNMIAYLRLVEKLTLNHHGLLHKIMGDRILCTWNVGRPVEDHTLLACKAALALLPEAQELYRSQDITIASAVTFGKVYAGNVGFDAFEAPEQMEAEVKPHLSPNSDAVGVSDLGGQDEKPPEQRHTAPGFKTYAIFGQAIELGGRIVFYQNFYNTATAVLCDEEVANRISQRIDVKPLEPIMRSGTEQEKVKIYTLLGLDMGRNMEHLERLELFNEAYKLFINRKFLEAEKAFCNYTKVNGYDNVVERLQKLVSLGKVVDDQYIHDVTHL